MSDDDDDYFAAKYPVGQKWNYYNFDMKMVILGIPMFSQEKYTYIILKQEDADKQPQLRYALEDDIDSWLDLKLLTLYSPWVVYDNQETDAGDDDKPEFGVAPVHFGTDVIPATTPDEQPPDEQPPEDEEEVTTPQETQTDTNLGISLSEETQPEITIPAENTMFEVTKVPEVVPLTQPTLQEVSDIIPDYFKTDVGAFVQSDPEKIGLQNPPPEARRRLVKDTDDPEKYKESWEEFKSKAKDKRRFRVEPTQMDLLRDWLLSDDGAKVAISSDPSEWENANDMFVRYANSETYVGMTKRLFTDSLRKAASQKIVERHSTGRRGGITVRAIPGVKHTGRQQIAKNIQEAVVTYLTKEKRWVTQGDVLDAILGGEQDTSDKKVRAQFFQRLKQMATDGKILVEEIGKKPGQPRSYHAVIESNVPDFVQAEDPNVGPPPPVERSFLLSESDSAQAAIVTQPPPRPPEPGMRVADIMDDPEVQLLLSDGDQQELDVALRGAADLPMGDISDAFQQANVQDLPGDNLPDRPWTKEVLYEWGGGEVEAVTTEAEEEFVRPKRKGRFTGSYSNPDADLRKAYQEAKESDIPVSIRRLRETFPDAAESTFQEIERDYTMSRSSVRSDFDSAPSRNKKRKRDQSEETYHPKSLSRSRSPTIDLVEVDLDEDVSVLEVPPFLEPETDVEFLASRDALQLPAFEPPVPVPIPIIVVEEKELSVYPVASIFVALLFFYLATQAT